MGEKNRILDGTPVELAVKVVKEFEAEAEKTATEIKEIIRKGTEEQALVDIEAERYKIKGL